MVGASESVLVKVISDSEELPASSVTLRLSFPSSVNLSPELTAFVVPSFPVKVMETVQVVDLSSFQEATRSSPIFNWLPEIVREGPEMTFMLLFDIVIVGAVVSFSGVGGVGSTGVTGVGGVGSTGSSPPQDTRTESTRNQAKSREGKNLCMT